uniref:NADH-ubiquinone oxidoreductase chain 5 n=1 Tax=Rasboroides vaterifloris TaxID=244134 RepID=F3Y758_9TELE|nr:NADH dehydrogenase subunit 5 [Rasboroides vaterifloris]BAK23209.1 NADH dehydrogenase subunit 5 [Rasboroides vaterifloris]
MTNVLTSLMILSITILICPLLMTLSPKPKTPNQLAISIKTAVSHSFYVSFTALMIFINLGVENICTSWYWTSIYTFDIFLGFNFDHYSLIFTPVALFVAWSILEFALWYMHADPLMDRFFKYLLLFLVAMIILVTANNMFQLFIGWEGVGIMSFLLIGWWSGRADANTSALQAIIYNRVGDVGFIMAIAWFAMQMNTWNIQEILTLSEMHKSMLPLAGIILAAMGKSAQFTLHPWLPAAMEGPTPVSALLHSSTMVVAGIFLLVRLHPLMQNNNTALTTCLYLGLATTLFSAACALTQNDIKKIVAFSTSSQLGLMMMAIGLNQPQLAFFHICTHAFFKAMLFLCSGMIIHKLKDEQDIRKMGNLMTLMPTTTTYLLVGNLALSGIPFLAGFYSKDAILESLITSKLSVLTVMLTLIAASFTAAYSYRLMYYVTLGPASFNPKIAPADDAKTVLKPIKRLAWGSILAGFIIWHNMMPEKTATLTMPMYLKLMSVAVIIVGLLTAKWMSTLSDQQIKNTPMALMYHSFSMLGYCPMIIHRIFPKLKLTLGHTIGTMLDKTWQVLWVEKMTWTLTKTITYLNDAQQAKIKTYLTIFSTSLTMMTLLYFTFL